VGSSPAAPPATWRDGAARTAILRLLDEALVPRAPGFVAPERLVVGRENASAGALSTDPAAEPILTSADRRGWTVVSLARDWERVF
jgi:hypothetical protein